MSIEIVVPCSACMRFLHSSISFLNGLLPLLSSNLGKSFPERIQKARYLVFRTDCNS